MHLPKVLIINQPFNSHTGGGVTLSNLFAGWDKDKIAVTCYSYLLHNVDTSICDKYYQLGHKELRYIFPFNILRRKHFSGLLELDKKKNPNSATRKSRLRIKVITQYFYPIIKYLGLTNRISRLELSSDFCNWLNDFKPDIIYAQATARESLLFISLVHSYLKRPLVFHMMDDWPAVVSHRGLFRQKEHKRNESEFINLLDKADALMGVSDEMAREYKTRYNKTFITFHNPIDIQFWKRYQKSTYELTDSPTILYAGRIGLGIDASLELIAKAIQQVNHSFNLSVKFALQTKEKPLWSSKYECVRHRGFIAYDDLPKAFSDADFLILPYDFSLKSIQFISYSMPTKATEYMISGTPIIIFAPDVTAIVNYAKKYKWAQVVTENNLNSLCEAIAYLIQNKPVRQQIAQNAIKAAEENHDSLKVTNHFREVLCSINNT